MKRDRRDALPYFRRKELPDSRHRKDPGARPGGYHPALRDTEQVRDVVWQVFDARRDQQHAQGAAHKPFEYGMEVSAAGGIQPRKGLV